MQDSLISESSTATRLDNTSSSNFADENLCPTSNHGLCEKSCDASPSSSRILKLICLPQNPNMDPNKDRLSLFEILSKNPVSDNPAIGALENEDKCSPKKNSFAGGIDFSNLKKLGSGKLVQNFIRNDGSKSADGSKISPPKQSPSKSPNFKALKNMFKKVNFNDLKKSSNPSSSSTGITDASKQTKHVPILPKPASSSKNAFSVAEKNDIARPSPRREFESLPIFGPTDEKSRD
ncbi:uncharacterized protein LOC141901795 [Tubulanus polymorphus]|uniref:uncharacterized protein LOC141901795 n=1 Tax=Tubulanus polymorphus TaxID=672921 RepID=UPI003DA2E880